MAASQRGGKTEIGLNAIGYFIDSDPSPQIFITYSIDMARKLSTHRIARMIAASAKLRGRVAEARSRDSTNTILDKAYDGGELTIVGANSPGGLSMSPKRVALFDEIDRYPASAGTEGDPIAMALMRLEAYWNAVKLYVTSPGIRETSRSWRLWKLSDQREWFIDCTHCAKPQVPDWNANVEWEKDETGAHKPETARYVCRHCGSVWTELERWAACSRGRYIATAEFQGLAGFRISALGIAHVQLEHLVRKWISAQGNPEEVKVFKNTVLAEWWDEQFHSIERDEWASRCEVFIPRDGRFEAPEGVALLTQGIDIQDNRIEISTYGWGAGEESWCLGHDTLFGDPASAQLWEDLDAFISKPWPMARGGFEFVRGICIDTGGHHTQAAYDFCGSRFRRITPDGGRQFVFAIKGQKGAGELWPRQASKVTSKVPLWPLRVDVGKEQLYGRLMLVKPGPGYIHFPSTFKNSFFKSLTAEKLVITRHKITGREVRTWKLKVAGSRNEALDCGVYGYAALCGLRAMGFDLEAYVAALPPVFHPLASGAVPAPPTQVPVAPSEPEGGRRRRWRQEAEGSWLGDTSGWLEGR